MQPIRFAPLTVALVALLSVAPTVWPVDLRRGDSNTDSAVDVSDAVLTLGYLFTGDDLSCVDAAEVNDDSAVDLSDPVSLLRFLFLGGTAPAEPGLECGFDPTTDTLGCDSYDECGDSLPFRIVDGYAIADGDIIVGYADELLESSPEQTQGILAALHTPDPDALWPGGLVPFIFSDRLADPLTNDDQVVRDRVDFAMEHFELHTSIRFVERTSGNDSDYPDYARFVVGDECSSYLGRQRRGPQDVTLSTGCGQTTTLHEIGNLVGLKHEHQRWDRDRFIEIVWENVDHTPSFEISDAPTCGPYDYASIMHYAERDSIISPEPVYQDAALSFGDIWTVRALCGDLAGICHCLESMATGNPPGLGRTNAPAPGGKADLVVESFEAIGSPESLRQTGFEVRVRIVVRNVGTQLADPFRVNFDTFERGPNATHVDCCPPGETRTVTAGAIFSESVRGQTIQLRAVVDESDLVEESDELNNTSRPISVTFPSECFEYTDDRGVQRRVCVDPSPRPVLRPDLVISWFSVGAPRPLHNSGFSVSIRATLENRGRRAATDVRVVAGSTSWSVSELRAGATI